MKVVNLEELSRMPNGTVFSEIDPRFHREFGAGDFDICGLNVMCGHSKYSTEESGFFNGVLHMLNYVSVRRDSNGKLYLDSDYNFDEFNITDTAKCDYDKDAVFVVYDKTDVIEIINILQWALTDCKSDLLVRSEFVN